MTRKCGAMTSFLKNMHELFAAKVKPRVEKNNDADEDDAVNDELGNRNGTCECT